MASSSNYVDQRYSIKEMPVLGKTKVVSMLSKHEIGEPEGIPGVSDIESHCLADTDAGCAKLTMGVAKRYSILQDAVEKVNFSKTLPNTIEDRVSAASRYLEYSNGKNSTVPITVFTPENMRISEGSVVGDAAYVRGDLSVQRLAEKDSRPFS
jgi:hypothetical protein